MSFEPTLVLNEKGLRLAVWPFRPNWNSPVKHAFEWKTDVLTAYNGSEQRRALRTKPRIGLEYNYLLANQLSFLHDTLISSNQHASFAIPHWLNGVKTTAALVSGATTIPIVGLTHGFFAGELAFIYQDETTYELVRVLSVAEGLITVDGIVSFDWAGGTSVYPLVIGHMETSVPVTRNSSTVLSGSIKFLLDPTRTPYPTYSALPAVTYLDDEVLTEPHNWRDDTSIEFLNEFRTADGSTGAIRYYKAAASRARRDFKFWLKGKDRVEWFKAFIDRRKGQQKSFWVEGWHDNFIYVLPDPFPIVAEPRRVIFVQGESLARLFQSTPYRHIAYRTAEVTTPNLGLPEYRATDDGNVRITDDGGIRIREEYSIPPALLGGTNGATSGGTTTTPAVTYYLEVVSAEPVNGMTLLTVDQDIPVGLPVEGVEYVRWLFHCRMSSDKVDIEMITDDFATPTLNMVTTVPKSTFF